MATAIVGVILAVGICFQIRTTQKEDAVVVPITYLTGVLIALLPLGAALAVVILAVTVMIAIRSYIGFLLAGMTLSGVISYLLGGTLESGIIVSFLNVVALLAGFFVQREFVLPIYVRSKAIKVPAPAR